MLEDIFNLGLEGVAAGQHLLHVKDDAVVNRVCTVGMSAVNDAVADENDVASFSMHLGFIERKRQRPLNDEGDLIFHMPVIRHVEARVMLVDMVELYWEIKTPALTKFVISVMFHKKYAFFQKDNIIIKIAIIVLFYLIYIFILQFIIYDGIDFRIYKIHNR